MISTKQITLIVRLENKQILSFHSLDCVSRETGDVPFVRHQAYTVVPKSNTSKDIYLFIRASRRFGLSHSLQ